MYCRSNSVTAALISEPLQALYRRGKCRCELGDLDGSKADADRCALPIGGAGGSGRLQGRCRQ
eukprot:4229935-Pyramimonas_sp.AAC.2